MKVQPDNDLPAMRALDFICAFVTNSGGYGPTLDEIQTGARFRNRSASRDAVAWLIKAGYLERTVGTNRTLRLTTLGMEGVQRRRYVKTRPGHTYYDRIGSDR